MASNLTGMDSNLLMMASNGKIMFGGPKVLKDNEMSMLQYRFSAFLA